MWKKFLQKGTYIEDGDTDMAYACVAVRSRTRSMNADKFTCKKYNWIINSVVCENWNDNHNVIEMLLPCFKSIQVIKI